MFKETVLKEGPWHEGKDANSMWMKMPTCIKKVASEEFRVTKGGKRETKETWWCNEEVLEIRERSAYGARTSGRAVNGSRNLGTNAQRVVRTHFTLTQLGHFC
jgi:hypothetical protein